MWSANNRHKLGRHARLRAIPINDHALRSTVTNPLPEGRRPPLPSLDLSAAVPGSAVPWRGQIAGGLVD
jgi:hypothetical protein